MTAWHLELFARRHIMNSATAAAVRPGWRYVLAFLAAVPLLLAVPLQAGSGSKGCGKYGGGIGGTGLSRGYLNAVASGPAIPSARSPRAIPVGDLCH
jgi:hypothetical protein